MEIVRVCIFLEAKGLNSAPTLSRGGGKSAGNMYLPSMPLLAHVHHAYDDSKRNSTTNWTDLVSLRMICTILPKQFYLLLWPTCNVVSRFHQGAATPPCLPLHFDIYILGT